VESIVRVLAVLCLFASLAASASAQNEGDLLAKRRVLPSVGPGLRAVKRGTDGRLYVLASPAPGLLVWDQNEKQVLAIQSPSPGAKGQPGALVFGEDCDVSADGKIYVADRGSNQIQVFSSEGKLLRSIPVPSPLAVAALPEGEVAVATLKQPSLVIVFDKNGRDVREFGESEAIAERSDLNRYLNSGRLGADDTGHLYYAFSYLPEPTVRQFDRLGYGHQDIQYTAIDAMPTALAARREIQRLEHRGDQPTFKKILTAIGLDHGNGEVWIALYNTLLHFDKDGNRRATYRIYTPEGARLEASVILVEQDRLLIGNDPLGIYEFERPDKKVQE
jgi:hypothetical protein